MKKTIFEEMGGIYIRHGDYLIPCLTLPEEEEQRLLVDTLPPFPARSYGKLRRRSHSKAHSQCRDPYLLLLLS